MMQCSRIQSRQPTGLPSRFRHLPFGPVTLQLALSRIFIEMGTCHHNIMTCPIWLSIDTVIMHMILSNVNLDRHLQWSLHDISPVVVWEIACMETYSDAMVASITLITVKTVDHCLLPEQWPWDYSSLVITHTEYNWIFILCLKNTQATWKRVKSITLLCENAGWNC